MKVTLKADGSTELDGSPAELALYARLHPPEQVFIPSRHGSSRVYQAGNTQVYEIDIGELPPAEVPRYVERVRQHFNKERQAEREAHQGDLEKLKIEVETEQKNRNRSMDLGTE